MTILSRLIHGFMISSLFVVSAGAQHSVSIEHMSFTVVNAFERGAAVSGELRLPASIHDRLPAVLILHSSPGFDGRGAFYAEALNQAGIATIEIDYLRGKGMPATPRHNLPHAYETLAYLARHPRIDPTRIGIMGFSWGGIISVLTSSEALTRQYTRGQASVRGAPRAVSDLLAASSGACRKVQFFPGAGDLSPRHRQARTHTCSREGSLRG